LQQAEILISGGEMTAQDRIYKCLNPIGKQNPVDLYPLAPRLDKLSGKNIIFNMVVGAEREILIPLEKKLRHDYPDINWNFRMAFKPVSDEEMGKTDALIQGVAF